jgi:hypothetical protein
MPTIATTTPPAISAVRALRRLFLGAVEDEVLADRFGITKAV